MKKPKPEPSICMRRRGGGLFPVDQINQEVIDAMPQGVDIYISARVPRNEKLLRWMWVLAGKIAKAGIDGVDDSETAMDVLCEACRHFTWVKSPVTGHMFGVRKSIGDLGADEQSRLAKRMVWATTEHILPGLDEGDLRREIEEMMIDNRDRGMEHRG